MPSTRMKPITAMFSARLMKRALVSMPDAMPAPRWHRAGGGVGHGRIGHAQADAGEQAAGQHRQPAGLLDAAAPGHQEAPRADGEQAGGNHGLRPVAQRQAFAERRQYQRRQGIGQQRQPGRQVGIAQPVLEIQGQVDHERPEAEVHAHRPKQRAGEAADAEYREIEQRIDGPPLRSGEDDETARGGEQAGQRGQAGKARHRSCVMNQARPNTATESETIPAQSSRRCCGSRDSSTPAAARPKAATAMGTCTRNTHCQLDSATMPAPMIGPRPRPMPKTTPQAPKAWRARRCRRTGATAPPAGRQHGAASHALKEAARDQPGGTAARPQARR